MCGVKPHGTNSNNGQNMSNATNEGMRQLIQKLEGSDAKILQAVAENISKSTRNRREVNLGRINQHTEDGEMIIVPGKVLGGGELDHKVTVYALKFSQSAAEKLKKAGSSIQTFEQLDAEKLAGKRVRILG
ncbi:MAG: 50S ribosomal protein L18e [Nanoarchaeota archaeon]|nr:50S ribosomal protein L18e [Nanoarchaeota archaeon]